MTRITIRHTTSAARVRLFFAMYPSDAVRKRIAEVQAGFDAVAARATTPDNFHLTLAFLGETATGERECYAQAADAVEIPAFAVTLDRFKHFSKRSLRECSQEIKGEHFTFFSQLSLLSSWHFRIQ